MPIPIDTETKRPYTVTREERQPNMVIVPSKPSPIIYDPTTMEVTYVTEEPMKVHHFTVATMNKPAPEGAMPGGLVTRERMVQEQVQQQQVEEAYRKVGWTPERISAMSPEEQLTAYKVIHGEEIAGYTYNPKTRQYLPYASAVPVGEYDIIYGVTALMPFLAPATLPASFGLTAGKIAASGLLSIGVGEGFSYGITGKPLSTEAAIQSALLGEILPIGSTAIMMGAGKVAPSVVSSLAGRTAISAGIGAGTSYVLSGGNIEETLKGAAFGAVFNLGAELVVSPLISEVRAKLPSWMPGSVKRLQSSEATIGSMGEKVPVWASEPISELDDLSLRIVGDVTEKPVGYGTSLDDLLNEYVGKSYPTGHATLNPEYFSLGKGEETLLRGFGEEGVGWRSAKQLYHFYSAPGSEEFVNIYGGYIGVGEGYSGSTPKIVFGGKPTAIVTADTLISPAFLKGGFENIDDFLSRISSLSGQTGIAPETTLGYSAERQLITPAAYSRFGEQLPGSMFVSEGYVGTFQIKQLPEGILGKIPIVRTMFSKYTNIQVYAGSFKSVTADVATNKILNVGDYAKESVRSTFISVPKIALPNLAVLSPRTTSPSIPQATKIVSYPRITRTASTFSAFSISRPKSFGSLPKSMPQITSPRVSAKPSKPDKSLLSYPTTISPIVYSSKPSKSFSPVSYPSQRSSPSRSSGSSSASQIKMSSSLPYMPKSSWGTPQFGSSSSRGKWFFKRHPIPTPKQVIGSFGFQPQRKRKKRRR